MPSATQLLNDAQQGRWSGLNRVGGSAVGQSPAATDGLPDPPAGELVPEIRFSRTFRAARGLVLLHRLRDRPGFTFAVLLLMSSRLLSLVPQALRVLRVRRT
jgi:hypothetical protein